MKGRRTSTSWLLAIVLVAILAIKSDASLNTRFLPRRQSSDVEQESTTPKSTQQTNQQSNTNDNQPQQQQPRLYPDLPQPPTSNGFPAMGPFAGAQPFNAMVNQPPTRFLPFQSSQFSASQRFNDPRFMPRPVSSGERQQSQAFVDGLGRRLLSMVGIKPSQDGNATSASTEQGSPQSTMMPAQETMRALQNSTVLQQLNKGVQTIYGSLSKMYNDTVQQQLGMLQQRFKQETANSTNPYQKAMAERVPQFFKSIAARVDVAQDNLNRILRDVMSVNNGSMNWTQVMQRGQNDRPRNFFGSFDQFMGNQDGGFLDQFGRQFGFGSQSQHPVERIDGAPTTGSDGSGMNNLANQLRYFWHNQVQPQIGMVRGQISRTWRDLTSSGALAPEPLISSRNNGNNLGSSATATTQSGGGNSQDLVDTILKEVDMNSGEYTLVNPKGDQQQQAGNGNGNNGQTQGRQQSTNMLTNQMQNGLMTMQRELNQLWMGLSNSLQNAIGNVHNTLNPQSRRHMSPMEWTSATNDNRKEVDPIENEIDGKIKDMSKLQREADAVYNVVQQQQNAQQRPNLDGFRNFFNGFDMNSIQQLPGRFSDSMNRFGTVVNDLWHQIPERWDDFVHRPRDSAANGPSMSSPSTSTTQKPQK